MNSALIKERPYKKKSKHRLGNTLRKIKLVYPKVDFSVKIFQIIVVSILVLGVLGFIIKNTLLKKENYIKNLSYSKESVEKYNDQELYSEISNLLKGKNFYLISNFKKSDILEQIQSNFPMVKNMKIVKSGPYSVVVWIDFYSPDIVVKLGDRSFGVLGNYDFEIYSGNTLGNDVFYAELPQYVSGIDSLYGLFHEIGQDQFIHDMNLINDSFPNAQRIVYLPGASMTAVFLEDEQRVYINNQNSLTGQIENFNMIKQYYDEFYSLKIIDLGSLEGNMIIVNK